MNTLEAIQEVFGNVEMSEKWLEKQFQFAALIRNLEREACAKVCESLNEDFDHLYVSACADVIRARGE